MATPVEFQKLLNGPALAPPKGELPNFVNPDNIRVAVFVASVLCVFTSTLVFWIRVYTRIYIFDETEWEDCKFSILVSSRSSLIALRFLRAGMGTVL